MNEEIQIGEYGRTNLGKIIKFAWLKSSEGEKYEDKVILIKNNKVVNEFYYFSKNEYIVKHSKNIIDLIEVGDIVNGEKVIGIFEIYNNEELIIGKRILTEYRKAQYTGLNNNYYLYETDIKTILTHEQYESNCYRIGE